jgi:hypothetical protein
MYGMQFLPHSKHCICITNTSRLIVFSKMAPVYFDRGLQHAAYCSTVLLQSGDSFSLNIYGLFEDTSCCRLKDTGFKIDDLGFSEIC